MVKVEIRACHHIVASILMFVDGISFEYGASPRELSVIKNKRAINIVEKGDGKIFWIASDGESFVDNGEFDGNILSESQSFVDYVKTFLMSQFGIENSEEPFMDLQSFFSKTASSKGGSSINFSDSFLRFASFAENDDSIYPYWRVFREEDKFMFVDKILINTENLNSSYRVSEFGESLWRDMIDYVIDRRRFFWMYMLENSELSEAAGTSGDDFYWILKDYKDHYMPNFTIRSIALFAELQLSYEPYCRDSDGFILNVSRCKHAKNYFEFIFNKLKFQTCNSYSLSVDGILGIINPHRLDYIKQSILNKIDELTAT